MIQYFSWGNTQQGILKELPMLKDAMRISRISYPHNTITKLNSVIGKARNVEEIDLSYNKICTFDQLFSLPKLKILNLSHNLISHIPRGVLKMKKIQQMDIGSNVLTELTSISALFQLLKIRKGDLNIVFDGNPVFDHYQDEIQMRIKNILQDIKKTKERIQSKKQLKQLQISKSFDLPKRLTTNNFEEDQNLIPKQRLSTGDAKARIQNSMLALNQFSSKFEVIAIAEHKGWNQNMLNLFRKQSNSVNSLIKAYRNIISFVLENINPFQIKTRLETAFIQTFEIQQLIKDEHCAVLEALSESQDVSMATYKVWVHFYRQLRSLIEKIRWEAWSTVQSNLRSQQIESLKLISPTKEDHNQKSHLDQLEGLLFSKQKLNSEGATCSECFIKNEEVKQLKEIVDLLTHENSELKMKVNVISQDNDIMQKEEGILGKDFKRRQQLIIQSLHQKIDSSVYQKILLQQARGIQDLIKCDRHVQAKLRLQNTKQKNSLCQTATALANDRTVRNEIQERQGVSQFNIPQGIKSSCGSKILPYFQRNSQKQSAKDNKCNRKTVSSVHSTQRKKIHEGKSNSRSQNALFSLNKTNHLQSDESATRVNQKSQFEEIKNKQIMVSDFVVTQPVKNREENIYSRRVLAELICKKSNEFNAANNNIQKDTKSPKYKKKSLVQVNQLNKSRTGRERLSEKSLPLEKMPVYTSYEYKSIKLKDDESYENYMRYHLRNNIIETLEKKGRRHSLTKNTSLSLLKKSKQNKITKDSALNPNIRKLPMTARDNHSSVKSYIEILGKFRS